MVRIRNLLQKSWRREFAAIFFCLSIVTIVFAFVFKVWNKDFHVPYFTVFDSGLINVYVGNVIKAEPWYVNWNAQYPFGAAATTQLDGIFHLLIQLLLGKVTGSIGLTSWIYYFSTYLFVALSTYLSLRIIRLGRMMACLGGVIFAFLPFHYYRIPHIDLVDYSYIPIFCSYCLLIYEIHHERVEKKKMPLSRKAWIMFACVCGLLQGMSSLYFALFSILAIVIMELLCTFKYRSNRTVKYTICIIGCVICGIIGTLIIDKVFTQKAAGQIEQIGTDIDEEKLSIFVPDSTRTLRGVKRYQLRPYVMFLPIMGHRIPALDEWGRGVYDSVDYLVEDDYMASVGSIMAVGVVSAFAILLRRKEEKALLEAASKMVVALLFCFMAGGFTLFLGLINPGIRSYNRGGVLIAFFAMVIVLKIVEDKVFQRCRPILRTAAVGVLFMIAIGSQTSPYNKKYIAHTPYDGLHFVMSYEEFTDGFYNVRDFYRQIAHNGMEQVAYWNSNFSLLSTGAALYVNDVSSNFMTKSKAYEEFFEWLGTQSTYDRIVIISYLGYDGILIDEMAEAFDEVYQELCAYLGKPVAEVSSYGDKLYLFDLQPIKANMGIDEIDRVEARERFYELFALYKENE